MGNSFSFHLWDLPIGPLCISCNDVETKFVFLKACDGIGIGVCQAVDD
jgi:hypothetical protein